MNDIDEQKKLKETLVKKYNEESNHEKTIDSAIDFAIAELKEVPVVIWEFLFDFEKRYERIFNTYSREVFIKIVRHLRFVGEQKRESHSIGANIIFFPNNSFIENFGLNSLTKEVKSFPLKKILDNENDFGSQLERTYRFINAKTSFYACDAENFYSIREFEGQEEDIFKNMLRTTTGDVLGLSIEEGTSCIRIFYNGKHIVDYLLSEQSGGWICHYSKVLADLFNDIKIVQEDKDDLVNKVLNLAYLRKGAMLILTNQPNASYLKTSQDITLGGTALRRVSGENFNCYANFDGAMVISIENECASLSRCGVFLSPKGDKLTDAYKLEIKNTVSGTRHEKAAMYACEHTEDYIIVISENRSISVLHGPNPIYWRDKLKNQEDNK